MRKATAKAVNYAIVLAVFAITLVHICGLRIADTANPAIITDYGDYHLVFWFPLETCIVEMIFAIMLLAKSMFFKACFLTKAVTWSYLLMSLASLLHILLTFDYQIYIQSLHFLSMCAIIACCSASILRWVIKR